MGSLTKYPSLHTLNQIDTGLDCVGLFFNPPGDSDLQSTVTCTVYMKLAERIDLKCSRHTHTHTHKWQLYDLIDTLISLIVVIISC